MGTLGYVQCYYSYTVISIGTLLATLTAYDSDRSGDVSFSIADVNFAGGIVTFADKTSNNHLYSVKLLVGPNVTDSTFDYDVSRSGNYQIIVICVRRGKWLWYW